jgi:DNA-binding XRE family transcriptional regulator
MDDPILELMKTIREDHERTQIQIAACMDIAEDTYRHIEKGRRPLPDIRRGFSRWIREFLECAGATPEERVRMRELAARLFVEELSHIMDGESPRPYGS